MKCNIPARDLAQKLDQTICRYDGAPVYVRVAGGNTLYLYPVHSPDSGKHTDITPDDPKFDISGIQLGYINGTNSQSCYYLSRIPVRKVKQGLTANAVRVSKIPGSVEKEDRRGAHVVYTKGFENMVLNKYPTLETALSALRKANADNSKITHQMAVTRDIALMIDANALVHVYFKNELVGWIEPNKFVVHVKNGSLSWVISKYLSHVLGWVID